MSNGWGEAVRKAREYTNGSGIRTAVMGHHIVGVGWRYYAVPVSSPVWRARGRRRG